MKTKLISILLLLVLNTCMYAQVGINTTGAAPNPAAMLDVSSTTKGFLPPRMTSAERIAILTPAAANGLIVFDTDTQSLWQIRTGAWVNMSISGGFSVWQQTGAGGNEIKNTNTGGFWSENIYGLDINTADNALNPPTAPVNGVGTRLMWIPSRSAFRVGSVFNFNFGLNESTYWDANNIGFFSFASGINTKANGYGSTAMGDGAIASGRRSTALGDGTTASGDGSFATGISTVASSGGSTAIGFHNVDNPNGLFMVGNGTFSTPKTAFIICKDNSRVGIGVEDPLAPLHVAGFGGISSGTGSFFYPGLPLSSNPTYTANLGILANEGIVSKTYVGSALNVIASDSRIKNIIGLSNNSEDLALLKKIEITDYHMKDVATWGNQKFKKVIAQQVEDIYPEAIKKQTAVIPDIYTLAEAVVYDAANKQLSLAMSKDYGLKVADKVELVHPEKGKIQAEVIAVNGNSFTVKNWNYAADKIFVFGREVSDFRSVDYEALSMLGISAIQALAKEVDVLKKQNAEFLNLKVRLEAIEASLKTNSTIFQSGK